MMANLLCVRSSGLAGLTIGEMGAYEGNPDSPQDLDDMLDLGHVNIYMFEGESQFWIHEWI